MHRTHTGPGRGFTLVELLVVVGIIGILISIVLAVAAGVRNAGRDSLTRSTIQTLEATLEEYMSARGSIPAALALDPRSGAGIGGQGTKYLQPVADARNFSSTTAEMINSVGLYLAQAREIDAIESLVQGVDAKVARLHLPVGTNPRPTAWSEQPQILTFVDAWGRPMRYVHPEFDGLVYGPESGGTYMATSPKSTVSVSTIVGPAGSGEVYGISKLRRNAQNTKAGSASPEDQPDGDGGLCTGGRPYFYSAGGDGDPSTTSDNIYSVTPQFQKPGAGFGGS
jgi:prepilin-type N-terminal cleavage/methylation domain-containing protein